jgi:toxin ParE1/3/4
MSSPEWVSYFDPEAQLEFIRATEYYRLTAPNLNRKFIDAFEDTLAYVLDFPEASAVFHPPDIRRVALKKFPYYLVYIIEPDAIFIVAIAHERRDPLYWLSRLEEPGRR